MRQGYLLCLDPEGAKLSTYRDGLGNGNDSFYFRYEACGTYEMDTNLSCNTDNKQFAWYSSKTTIDFSAKDDYKHQQMQHIDFQFGGLDHLTMILELNEVEMQDSILDPFGFFVEE